MKIKIIMLILIVVLSASCTAPSPVIMVTATSQPTNTLTPEIKPSETSTATPAPTETPTFTPTVTWTPLPTLSAQQSQTRIKELLETNDGCELPCWWGIIPNKTPWSEALHFLTPIIFDIGQGGSGNFYQDGKKHFATNFGFSYKLPEGSELGSIYVGVVDDIVDGFTVFPPATRYKYNLHQMLLLLGMPKQIYISAQQDAPYPILPPTVFVLDYSDAGVWASYGYIPSLVGEKLIICPKPVAGKVSIYDNVGGRLELFDPKTEYDRAFSIQEYADMVGGFTAKKIEDVTNMDIETFYNTFIDPKTKTCVETPAGLWP